MIHITVYVIRALRHLPSSLYDLNAECIESLVEFLCLATDQQIFIVFFTGRCCGGDRLEISSWGCF